MRREGGWGGWEGAGTGAGRDSAATRDGVCSLRKGEIERSLLFTVHWWCVEKDKNTGAQTQSQKGGEKASRTVGRVAGQPSRAAGSCSLTEGQVEGLAARWAGHQPACVHQISS